MHHYRVPTPAEHTKVEYKVPPRCIGLLYVPGNDHYPSLHRPPPSEPNTPNGNPHNLSSNNQHLATRLPTLNIEFWPMRQGLPAEALQHHFPPYLQRQLPFDTTMAPKRILTIALWFYFWQNKSVAMCMNIVQMSSG